MSDPAGGFELREVRVAFGRTTALDGISLTIAPGESVALLGPSGSGKTTLLRLLNASVLPTSGSVLAGGRDLAAMRTEELRRVRSSIGFIHQELDLVPTMRVVRNVLAGRLGRVGFARALRMMALPPRSMVHEAYEILERVGIPHKLYERTDRLSGGQKQRVAIARALFQDPVALLADEPVSSVDPARARDAVALLVQLSRERGLTLCMSLHDLELAKAYFPRLVGIREGRILFDASPEAVRPDQLATLYRMDADREIDDGT